MMVKISSVHFCPIKSLSFQSAQTLIIKKDIGIVEDRIFAFSRGLNELDAKRIEKDPSDRQLINFLTLKNSPVLNKYEFKYKNEIITILKNNKEIASYPIKEKKNLSKKLLELEPSLPNPTYLLKNELFPFYDTTSSSSILNTVSLINLNSIKDFSKKINKDIEFKRFRGNIYIKDLKALEERNWINKVISINNTEFKVLKNIPRCSATNLKINSKEADINLPNMLKKFYGHIDMGIYLIPLNNGQIQVGDEIDFN
ncbi:MOSC domain-containing protein [Candidatus Pelagibacter sp.]|nr:MOSC domain-containing protein [Candidatus Pelagibacter sp.]